MTILVSPIYEAQGPKKKGKKNSIAWRKSGKQRRNRSGKVITNHALIIERNSA